MRRTKRKAKEAKKAKQRVPLRWYKDDPLVRGRGLGLVLHEKRRKWVVARVLRGSPADRAKLRTGDVLRRLDDYKLKHGDGMELLRLLRSGSRRTTELAIHRKRKGKRKGKDDLVVSLSPKPMALILSTHGRLAGGFSLDTLCHTCKLCEPSISGFAACGKDVPDPETGMKCSFPCMLA